MTKEINCVIVGQTYALKSIKLFLESVRKCIDEYGLQIKVYYYGGSSLGEVDIDVYDDFIINKGWVHPSNIIEEIKIYDFAFLPYFDEDNLIVGRMSFPSKLIVYVSAFLPVLYVGQIGSSPASVISKNRIGMVFSQSEFVKYFNSTLIEDMLKLKASSGFKTKIDELNKNLFSKGNFRETLSKLEILKESQQIDQEYKVLGLTNKVKDMVFMNRVRDASLHRQNYSLIFLIWVKQIFNTFNLNITSGALSSDIAERVSCVKIELSKDGITRYRLTNIMYVNQSAYEEKVGVFSKTSQYVDEMNEFVKNNNIIVLSDDFKKSQGNLASDNLVDVLRAVSPKNTNTTILVKQYVRRFFLFNTKKVLIRNTATLADFYILGLVNAQNIVMSSEVFFTILSQNSSDEESGMLSHSRLISNIFSSIQHHHIHDPRMHNFFRIKFHQQQIKYSTQELKEIFQKTEELDSRSSEQIVGKQRILERFTHFLYLLGKNENDIRNFMLNHIESNESLIESLILSGKPMKKFYIFKKYLL